jgi:saccharopine dehydrogenase-like NADP-dependent oxidoreductase
MPVGTKKVLVLGCGLCGAEIILDLAARTDLEVTAAGRNAQTLADVAARNSRIKTLLLEFSDSDAVRAACAPFDLVVVSTPRLHVFFFFALFASPGDVYPLLLFQKGSAPGPVGLKVMKAVIDAGKDFVDVSAMEEDFRVLDEAAKRAGVTVIGACGICPGLSSMLTAHAVSLFDGQRCENCKIMVGGLPVKPRPPFLHTATWSVWDTLYQWAGECVIIRDGHKTTIPTMEEPETVVLPGVPGGAPLEALTTDGLGTLPYTIKARNMIEKTLRYPGTKDLLKTFRDCRLFSSEKVAVPGYPVPIAPLDLTAVLLAPLLKHDVAESLEFTVMQVYVDGLIGGKLTKITYDMYVETDTTRTPPVTSMARSTLVAAMVAQIMLDGHYKCPGVHPPEDLGFVPDVFAQIVEHTNARKLHFTEKIEH